MEGEHTFQYLSLTVTKMQGFSHTAKNHKAWKYCTYSFSKVIVWGHSLGTSIATRALVASNFTQVCTSYYRSLYIREACLIIKSEHMIDNLRNKWSTQSQKSGFVFSKVSGLVLESPFNTMEDEVT